MKILIVMSLILSTNLKAQESNQQSSFDFEKHLEGQFICLYGRDDGIMKFKNLLKDNKNEFKDKYKPYRPLIVNIGIVLHGYEFVHEFNHRKSESMVKSFNVTLYGNNAYHNPFKTCFLGK